MPELDHWNDTWFVFAVGLSEVGEAYITDESFIEWVPESVHLNKSEDGEIKISDSDGEKR